MSERMNEFRDFVKKHPLLKEEVKNNNFTWQNIFEEWTLYGENSDTFIPFKGEELLEAKEEINTINKKTSNSNPLTRQLPKDLSPESLKTIMNYVKKINPDNLTKTLSSAQKIMAIIQGFIGGTAAGTGIEAASKLTGDPLFDKKFDEWY